MMELIKNGLVYTKDFTFQNKDILIEDNVIKEIACVGKISVDKEKCNVIDAAGKKVIPGLVDIHFHGCMGYDFCDGTDEAIRKMAEYEKSIGVAAICPATMTLSEEQLKQICTNAGKYKAYDMEKEAELCGINLEGPFVSKDRLGAQNPRYVHKADSKFLQELINDSNGLTKLITIAPETEGAIECISEMKDKIRFSIGHTMSDYDTAVKAYKAGAKHATHLYNAMTGLSHREPGVVGAARDCSEVMVEMICDGIHIHPAVIRATFEMFGANRIILISDSMRACGMEDGDYELGGLPVIKKGREARLKTGELAGSVTNVYDCMVNVIRFGIPAEDAIKAATYNPAKAIGIDDKYGTIDIGKNAAMLIVDDEWKIEKVR